MGEVTHIKDHVSITVAAPDVFVVLSSPPPHPTPLQN